MPPKKPEPSKKKKTSVEDKTFGMKNKKGATAKKQIAQFQAQAQSNKSADEKRKEAEKDRRAQEKAAADLARKEAAELFKPVQTQKVPLGVDPKTVLCIFFKQGNCEKGRKCKFSHDLAVERKSAKRDLYADSREGDQDNGDDKKNDTMDNWDEAKLRNVVLNKHGNPRTTTDKVCKYFIEAVENQKYGWFWTCPNGGDKCMYRHALPPGFVLKTKDQRAAEKALMDKSPLKTLTLEDWLESERHKLTGTLTPVTPESFAEWKKKRLDKKAAEEEAQKMKEATGRALFESGDWKGVDSSAEEDEDEDEEEDEDEDEDESTQDAWNLEALRQETERIRAQKEEERLAKLYIGDTTNGGTNDREVAQEGEG